MSHSLFTPDVRSYIEENDILGMKTFCEELQPVTVAEVLNELLVDHRQPVTVEDAWHLLEQSDIRTQADIFEYLNMGQQVEMVAGTGAPHMARLIEQMAPDDRVDLLRKLEDLDERTPEDLLRHVDEAARRDIKSLLNYEEGTVGALMTTDYAYLPAQLTTTVAIDRLRRMAPNSETIYYIYILEEPSRRLLGIVSLRDLMLAPRQATLADLMETEVTALHANDDRERAVELLRRKDLLALPVIDEQGRLVGIVTHDDVMDAAVAEATEDLQRQASVSPITQNYLDAPFFEVWRKRVFWLAVIFVVQMSTVMVMQIFEPTLSQLIVLSLFVPLCISVGGNSGSQAATLITRALSLGQVTIGRWFMVLRHEFAMGLALGLFLALLAFSRGAITQTDSLSSLDRRDDEFLVKVDKSVPLAANTDGTVIVPAGAKEAREVNLGKVEFVKLPEAVTLSALREGSHPDDDDPGRQVYHFPPGCEVRKEPVSRWSLGYVIALSVGAICLWGTLIGSMLPLVLQRFKIDPALASSAFVATFVDITGILIYLSIASIFLL